MNRPLTCGGAFEPKSHDLSQDKQSKHWQKTAGRWGGLWPKVGWMTLPYVGGPILFFVVDSFTRF